MTPKQQAVIDAAKAYRRSVPADKTWDPCAIIDALKNLLAAVADLEAEEGEALPGVKE